MAWLNVLEEPDARRVIRYRLSASQICCEPLRQRFAQHFVMIPMSNCLSIVDRQFPGVAIDDVMLFLFDDELSADAEVRLLHNCVDVVKS